MHDKYTISVYSMLERGFDLFPCNYPLHPRYKKMFEKAFVEYYLYSESAFYMPDMFIQRLGAMLNLKARFYSDRLDLSRIKYNPLINKALRQHGFADIEKLNTHDYESMRQQLEELYENRKRINDEQYKQRIDENGSTTGAKDSTTGETMVQDETGNETLDKTIDTTGQRDGQHHTTTEGESTRVNNLSERAHSVTTNEGSDTPQNMLGTISPPSALNPYGLYLTTAARSTTDSTHNADITETIENSQTVDGTTGETTTGQEKTAQTVDTTGNTSRQTDTTYGENTDGTHTLTNDEKSRRTAHDSETGTQTNTGDTRTSGGETFNTKQGEKSGAYVEGFENTSLSRLIIEAREAQENTLMLFVLEFENLFMGVL